VIWAYNLLDSFCFPSCICFTIENFIRSGKIPDRMDLLQM